MQCNLNWVFWLFMKSSQSLSIGSTTAIALRRSTTHWGSTSVGTRCPEQDMRTWEKQCSWRNSHHAAGRSTNSPRRSRQAWNYGFNLRTIRTKGFKANIKDQPGCEAAVPPTPLPAALPTPGPPVPWNKKLWIGSMPILMWMHFLSTFITNP